MHVCSWKPSATNGPRTRLRAISIFAHSSLMVAHVQSCESWPQWFEIARVIHMRPQWPGIARVTHTRPQFELHALRCRYPASLVQKRKTHTYTHTYAHTHTRTPRTPLCCSEPATRHHGTSQCPYQRFCPAALGSAVHRLGLRARRVFSLPMFARLTWRDTGKPSRLIKYHHPGRCFKQY